LPTPPIRLKGLAAWLARRALGLRLETRIGVLLALLSLVPLAGASWVTAVEISRTRQERDRAQQVEEGVKELVALTELRTLLLAERNWQGALIGLDTVGISLGLVRTMTGLDLESELDQTQEDVDELVVKLDADDVARGLSRFRRSGTTSISQLSEAYLTLEAAVAEDGRELFEHLVAEAADSTDGSDTVRALRVLDAATDAQQAVSGEQTGYFGARFGPAQTSEAYLLLLVEQRAERLEALKELVLVAASDSVTLGTLDQIETSVQVRVFEDAITGLVDERLGEEGDRSASSLDTLLDDTQTVAMVFGAANDSADLYLALVNAAAVDVETASNAMSAHAEDHAREALLAGLVLVVATVAFTAVVIRTVAAPLHQLARAAQELRDGRTGHRMKASGPIEVREAALAINDASIHLDLVQRQATALAEGRLDDEVLAQTAPGAIGRSLQDAVQTLAASMAEREGFRRQLAHEAQHDALTGLPNRKACLDQLATRLRDDQSRLAALFIDLDGFKEINDDHGHHAGDAVLAATARRLQASVRQGDHVGRLGGDEFLVVAEPISGQEEAIQLAERLMAAIIAPIDAGAAIVRVEASIGVALPGGYKQEPDELIREADLALYEAKDAGRGRVVLCDDRLLASKDEQVALEVALRRAIGENELTVYYQPIVDADDHRIVGLEALVRWRQQGRGVVGPDRFIPIAERSELITELDRWVVSAVAAQLDSWRHDPALRDIPVSINLSSRTLGSDDVVDDILTPLAAFGIDPTRIVVEVTESALLEDLDLAGQRLGQLKEAGIRVAIDDYGTGFTSLAHLRALPIDVLKIDRTFVDDAAEGRLTKLIVDIGHLLGAAVTAEGVETAAQAQLLRGLGADRLQGYLFGKPFPSDHFTLAGAASGAVPIEDRLPDEPIEDPAETGPAGRPTMAIAPPASEPGDAPVTDRETEARRERAPRG
jgi:diguanylate cyclase (GGDEF)-like protein